MSDDSKMLRTILPVVAVVAGIGMFGATALAQEANDEHVQMVAALLADPDKEMRAIGWEQVRTELKGESVTHKFAAMLPDLSPEAQAGLIRALAERGDPAALDDVRNALQSSNDRTVQTAAIAALGDLGGESEAASLIELLDGVDKEKKHAAHAALVRLRGNDTAAALAAAMLDDRTPEQARIALAAILAERRAVGLIPQLLAAAKAANADVRRAAMRALSQLAGPDHVAAMADAVLAAELGAEREAAEKALAAVCLRGADPATRAQPLLEAMRQHPPAEQLLLLSVVGRIGGDSGQKVVLDSIDSDDPARVAAGIRALCNWPDASVASQLTEQAKSADDPQLRILALRALVRVAPLADGRSNEEKLSLLKQAMSMCNRDVDKRLVLARVSAIRTTEALHFITPYLDQPEFAEQAALAVVELAHHRGLREPHKAEFDAALDRVLAVAKDPTTLDRAKRYKEGRTWARPRADE
jgi:HEAT repeat protein